jgi:hypothetical protein
MEDDEIIGGRGGSDQEGGMASMVYAGKIIKDLGLADQYTMLVTGTVQEEDCDGLCWQYIIEEHGRPEFVISTEPTDCQHLPRPPWPDGDPDRGAPAVSAATAPRPSAATTPSTRWADILIELQGLNHNLATTTSWARAR